MEFEVADATQSGHQAMDSEVANVTHWLKLLHLLVARPKGLLTSVQDQRNLSRTIMAFTKEAVHLDVPSSSTMWSRAPTSRLQSIDSLGVKTGEALAITSIQPPTPLTTPPAPPQLPPPTGDKEGGTETLQLPGLLGAAFPFKSIANPFLACSFKGSGRRRPSRTKAVPRY
jgi:hypothetical protein